MTIGTYDGRETQRRIVGTLAINVDTGVSGAVHWYLHTDYGFGTMLNHGVTATADDALRIATVHAHRHNDGFTL